MEQQAALPVHLYSLAFSWPHKSENWSHTRQDLDDLPPTILAALLSDGSTKACAALPGVEPNRMDRSDESTPPCLYSRSSTELNGNPMYATQCLHQSAMKKSGARRGGRREG